MEKCFQRNSDSPHTFTNRFGQDCMEMFDIIKFYTQEYICYRIDLKDSRAISFSRVAHSLFFGNTFYSLVLNPIFNNAYAIMPIVYHGDMPLVSRQYAPTIIRLSDYGVSNASVISNMYYMRYSWMEFRLRPFPYDTDCDPHVNQAKCLQACITHGIREATGKMPFTEIIVEAVDLKHLSYPDLYSMQENITSVENDCATKCRKRTCRYDYTRLIYFLYTFRPLISMLFFKSLAISSHAQEAR